MYSDSLTLYSAAVYLEGMARLSSKTVLNNSVMHKPAIQPIELQPMMQPANGIIC